MLQLAQQLALVEGPAKAGCGYGWGGAEGNVDEVQRRQQSGLPVSLKQPARHTQ